ncbi:MAG: hypothetical protein EXR75_02945 [Myxococcales bacterium]|nr:hypothetical protein [Myxococcales bacterium]
MTLAMTLAMTLSRKFVRTAFRVCAFAVACAAMLVTAPHASAGPRAPEPEAPMHRGMELVAKSDMVIRGVQFAKGSRVTVAAIAFRDGKPATVNLELKDGHVLEAVPFERVRRDFLTLDGEVRGAA